MNTQFLFFSGKGGVGKTSMACTTAIHLANEGKRTFIVTTDPASNLADVFEQPIGHKVTPIEGVDGLWAMEIDPDKATFEYKERALGPLRALFPPEIVKVSCPYRRPDVHWSSCRDPGTKGQVRPRPESACRPIQHYLHLRAEP